MFIDGFLALCSAVGAGSATEFTTAQFPTYARQPIAFSDPAAGVSLSANGYTFGQQIRGAVGRAIFDAPVGGNVLLVMPHPAPTATGRLPWDTGEATHLRLFLTALQPYLRGASFTGRFAAGTVLGTTSDRYDLVNPADLSQSPGNPVPLITTAPLTAGVALSVSRGVLQAAAMVPAGTE